MRTAAIFAGAAFPPARNPGAQRVLGWARFLPADGWKTLVIALPLDHFPPHLRDESLLEEIPGETTVLRPAPRLLRRLPQQASGYAGDTVGGSRRMAALRMLKRGLLWPDSRILWVGPAVRAAQRWSRAEPIDAIVSTSPENSSHLAGMAAAKRLGVPWVADFRDPWAPLWSSLPTSVHERVHSTMGQRIMHRADALVVVSQSLKETLAATYGITREKIHVVHHGMDIRTTVGSSAPSPPFRIVHTGALYGRREIAGLLEAIDALKNESDQGVRLEQYGPVDARVRNEIQRAGAPAWLRVIDSISHEEALRVQESASVLLLIPGEDSPTIPSKAFEYLGARRPILALCSPGTDAASLIQETRSGLVAPPQDARRIGAALKELIASDGLPSEPPQEDLDRYTRAAVTRQFAGILDRVSTGR